MREKIALVPVTVAVALGVATIGAGGGGSWIAAASGAGLRSCGVLPRTIGISVRASRGVSCREARKLMRDLMAGSTACYPHGYVSHPSCVVDGFHCSSHGSGDVSHGRCVKGRLEAVGST